jgi:hypothetical protein
MSPSYDPKQRLTEADPKPLGQRIPNPLHERVDELCDAVYRAGNIRPTKVRMLAALILAAPTDPRALDRLLRAFDSATVGEAVVAPQRSDSNVIQFPERKSGPRSRPVA